MTSAPLRSRVTGRVTLSDVAQAAGVSPITVSRALRGERAVAPDLVERVQAAARTLGYVPDPAARALASQRSTHVTVLIPMLSNALFAAADGNDIRGAGGTERAEVTQKATGGGLIGRFMAAVRSAY